MQLKNTIDTNMFPQSIGLEEIVNARELGGYVGADGRKVKRGVLLRTGALSEISEADRRRLLEQYHLTDIIDFRTSFECEAAPDPEMDFRWKSWLKQSAAKKSGLQICMWIL